MIGVLKYRESCPSFRHVSIRGVIFFQPSSGSRSRTFQTVIVSAGAMVTFCVGKTEELLV